MADFLEKMLENVEETISSGYYKPLPFPRIKRSLVAAIKNTPKPIIAELKPSSPSHPLLITSSPISIGTELVSAGACALSILTEPKIFKGDIALLAQDFGVPLLQKDFILSEKQMVGGDCVLLISAFLELAEKNTNKFISAAHSRGLEVLLEVHTLEEFKQAKKTKADIIGINNRNLNTLKIDLATTEKILSKEKKDRPTIGESGVQTPEDAARVFGAGADGILVGTGLLTAKDRKAKLRELRS